MSNIFGIFSQADCNIASIVANHLSYWNKLDGCIYDLYSISDSIKIGAYIDHYSDNYPSSVPVIEIGSDVAVIDAILYNRKELLSGLSNLDPGISDEELLYHYIRSNGLSALANVNGDFAGAIYHKENKTWTLFRDHMGIRPLFYYIDRDTLVFSTDIRAIASISYINTGINEEMLFKKASAYNNHSLCETDFKNIYLLPPASWMDIYFDSLESHGTSVVKNSSGTSKSSGKLALQVHTYWTLGSKKIRLNSTKDYENTLFHLIEDSIQRRLDAVSGIIGCEFSGGLDSSVIAAFINRTSRKAEYFCWSRDPEEYPLLSGEDERRHILEFCEENGMKCHFHSNASAQALWDYELKHGSHWPPYINTIDILEGALFLKSKGAKVVFTGHGGDEGVSHRANPYELWYHHEYLDFFKFFYQEKKGQNLHLLRTLHAIYYQFTKVHPQKKAPYHLTINGKPYLKQEFIDCYENKVEKLPLYFAYDCVKYIKNGGSRSRLLNVAVQGSAAGVRYMLPFLDYRVIDFAVSIPRAQYLDGYINRKVYRNAFKKLLTSPLANRRYKNSPSLDAKIQSKTKEELIELKNYNRNRIIELVNRLDKDLWSPYLNFDALYQVDFTDDFTLDDHKLYFAINEILNFCILSQDILLFNK